MNLTMLGVSGSGKTAFMSGLYETMGANDLRGFQVRSVSPSGNLLLANRQLESIAFDKLSYCFPKSTEETSVWSFDFYHETARVCAFEWIDYRGGILAGTAADLSADPRLQAQIDELQGHILVSNALLLFVDSILLTEYCDILRARRETGIDRITNLLIDYDTRYPERNLTFLIVLTKVDAVADAWKANDYDPLVRRGEEAFSQLHQLCRRKPSWTGGIVPVSAVGEGKAETSIKPSPNLQTPVESGAKLVGFPVPMNIGHSIFYCVGQTLKRMRDYTEAVVGQQDAEIVELLGKSDIFHRIWALITGCQDPVAIVRALRAKREQESASLRVYARYVDPLCVIAADKVRPFCGRQ